MIVADVTLDKLTIEIEAKSDSAIKSLESLEKSLGRMKGSMGGFNTSALDTLGTKLGVISNRLDVISQKAGTISKATPSINTTKLSKDERQINSLLEKIQDKFTRMGSLANAGIGGDSSALTSYSRQAVSLQGDIDVLKSKLEKFSGIKVQSEAFVQLDSQIEETRTRLNELYEQEQKLSTSKEPISNDSYVKLLVDINDTSNALDALIAKQQQMVSEGTDVESPFGNIQTALDDLISKFEETSGKVEQAKSQMGTPVDVPTDSLKANLEKVGQLASQAAISIGKVAGVGIKKGIGSLANAFKSLKSAIKGVRSGADKLHGSFDKGFKKVLKYGFGIRSIYVGFRRLRKVVINAFGALQNSGAFFDTTRRNIEGLKSSMSTLGYQFGAAFEPIFNAVAPALQTLINYLIKAMNVFSAFTAKLMGKDTYSKAVAGSSAVAGNVGSAAKSAKELNKQLQGFDELNNLTTNDNAGGGGGGGSAGDASATQYVSESVDSVLGDFGKSLAEKIKAGDWEAVGNAISTALTAQLKKLNSKWNDIFGVAANFGTNLANFFNGLIKPDLFAEMGTAIGNALNTALIAALNFAEHFNWENLGTSIAAGINSFVRTNPLKLAVENFNTWVNGILTTLIIAVQETEWDTIGQHIADAIGDIDAYGIAWKLGTLADSLVSGLYDILSVKETWVNIGTKIAEGINGVSDSVDGKKLAKLLNAVKDALFEAISTAVKNINWVEIGKDVTEFLCNLDIGTVTLGLLSAVIVGGGGRTLVQILSVALGKALLGKELTLAQNLAIKALGATIVLASVKVSETNLGSGGAKGLVENSLFDLLGAVGTYGGLRMMGVPMALSLKIALVKLAWDIGTNIGTFIGEWVSKELWGASEGGGKKGDLATYYSTFTWSGFIDEIKLASEEGTLKKAWDNLWDELYKPVFDEAKDVSVKLNIKITKAKETITKVKEDFDAVWDRVWNGKGDTPKGYNGAPSDVAARIQAQEKANGESDDVGYNIYMGIYNGFKAGMMTVNPIAGLVIYFRDEFVKKIKETFGIKSPATEMMPYGENIYEGIIKGFKNSTETTGDTFSVDTAVEALKSKLETYLLQKFTGWDAGTFISQVATLTLNLGIDVPITDLTSVQELKNTWDDLVNRSRLVLEADFKDRSAIMQVREMMDDLSKLKKKASITIKTKLTGKGHKKLVDMYNTYKAFGTGAKSISVTFTDLFSEPLRRSYEKVRNAVNLTVNAMNKKYKSNIPTVVPFPRMATGGIVTGTTVSIIGENGAEAVVPLENNTGWLKKMSNMMVEGMMEVNKYNNPTKPSTFSFSSQVSNGIANTSNNDNTSELIAKQNELLERQNQLLEVIARKDVTISSKEVYNATLKEARNYNNKTASSPFLF